MIMRYAATAVIAAILGAAAVYAWLGPSKDELARLGAARDTLSMEVKTLNERLRALESGKLALEKKGAESTAELDRMRSALAKATASAAEGEKLARKLEATGKGLDEAKARAAELNKSYEALLKEQKQLSASDAARASRARAHQKGV